MLVNEDELVQTVEVPITSPEVPACECPEVVCPTCPEAFRPVCPTTPLWAWLLYFILFVCGLSFVFFAGVEYGRGSRSDV